MAFETEIFQHSMELIFENARQSTEALGKCDGGGRRKAAGGTGAARMNSGAYRSILAAASAAVFTLGVCSIEAPAQTHAQATPPAIGLADETNLKAFAQASLDVEAITVKWAERMKTAQSNDDAQQMRVDTISEISEAVQSNGLEMEIYSYIYRLAQNDPNVAATIQRYRQELQFGPNPERR